VVNKQNKLLYDTYEYVSTECNLRSLLENRDFMELICNNTQSEENSIKGFQNGE